MLRVSEYTEKYPFQVNYLIKKLRLVTLNVAAQSEPDSEEREKRRREREETKGEREKRQREREKI